MGKPTKRFRRRHRYTTFWVLLAVVVFVRWWFASSQRVHAPSSLEEGIYVVQRVVDGDTLLIKPGARVRLIGIDAPESVTPHHVVEPWGPEASQYARDFVRAANDQVRLSFEVERIDQYGRFLAYVWDGDKLLNEQLVRAGLALARPDFRFSSRMKSRLTQAEEEARREGRGIWSHDDRR